MRGWCGQVRVSCLDDCRIRPVYIGIQIPDVGAWYAHGIREREHPCLPYTVADWQGRDHVIELRTETFMTRQEVIFRIAYFLRRMLITQSHLSWYLLVPYGIFRICGWNVGLLPVRKRRTLVFRKRFFRTCRSCSFDIVTLMVAMDVFSPHTPCMLSTSGYGIVYLTGMFVHMQIGRGTQVLET